MTHYAFLGSNAVSLNPSLDALHGSAEAKVFLMLSSADKKEFVKSAVEGMRKCGPEEIELVRRALLGALSSGQPVTLLSGPEIEDGDDENLPDTREREIGFALDSLLLARLPVNRSGEILTDAEIPPEVMTAAGTALRTSVENGSLCLTDPYGAKARIKGMIVDQNKLVCCITDKRLMLQKWFSEDPIPAQDSVDELLKSAPVERSSLAAAAGHWDEFDVQGRKGSGMLHVRSRAADLKVRQFVLQNQLFRVSCTLSDGQLDAEGMPRSMTALNRFEDDLLLHLVRLRPQTFPVAVVTQKGSRDFYYTSTHNGALCAALERVGERPFEIKTTRMKGNVAFLLDIFTPLDKRVKAAGWKSLLLALITGKLRVSDPPAR